jgi:murein DD-endopeptidase MepM/ murein hydrolase activator NlpD
MRNIHNTLDRIITVAVLLFVLVPAGAYALVAIEERHEAAQELDEAIGLAASRSRLSTGVYEQRTQAMDARAVHERELAALQRKKRDVRVKMGEVIAHIHAIENRYNVQLPDKKTAEALIAQRAQIFAGLAVARYRDAEIGAHSSAPDSGNEVGTLVGEATVTAHRAADGRLDTLSEDAQRKMIADLSVAPPLFDQLDTLKTERAALMAQFSEAQGAFYSAQQEIDKSEEQLAEIRRIVDDVNRQVVKLQSQLSRIDAEIKERAQKALIEKGLLTEEEIKKNDAMGPIRFQWPVAGRVSAGFHDESYRRFFGVPHQGIDIVVPQGTPVRSAAPGVVFLARDGGARGFSYILIGHRDGYATLYGHLSAFSVSNGQQIDAGQVIGLSGGRPGTHGAGPMTTAPHLHFEMIRNGTHIDARTMLPK